MKIINSFLKLRKRWIKKIENFFRKKSINLFGSFIISMSILEHSYASVAPDHFLGNYSIEHDSIEQYVEKSTLFYNNELIEKTGLNIPKIQEMVSALFSKIKENTGKELIVFIGITGSGKSAIIDYLLSTSMTMQVERRRC